MTPSRTEQTRESPSQPIRVLVVDDHARVRQGLRMFLSTCADIDLVAEAGSGAEALQRFAETCPDVVVMDLAAPGMDSPVITSQMKELNPDSQIIALASFAEAQLERRVLEAGAVCCVAKDSSVGTLVEAIHVAYAALGPVHMTFVQAKTGTSADLKAGTPSDGRTGAVPYDCPVSNEDEPATEEVLIG
jgi:two-component system, NarL family, response regulator LiaR